MINSHRVIIPLVWYRIDSTNETKNCMDSHLVEKEMATHSSVLAWRIPRTGKPCGLLLWVAQSRTRLKRLSSSSTSGVLNLRAGKVARDTTGQWASSFYFSDPSPYLRKASKETDNNLFSLSLILLLTCISYLFILFKSFHFERLDVLGTMTLKKGETEMYLELRLLSVL